MNRKLILGLLMAMNLVLAGLLVSALGKHATPGTADPNIAGPTQTVNSTPTVQPVRANQRKAGSNNNVPSTPFTLMYSLDTKTFAANLRGIGCPEETVKDILVAEISRRYRAQEEALRPKPADHVPISWSSNPSERELFQRRQEAAAIAREKAAFLRDALGYEVAVAMPLYAMTSSEQRFEGSLAALTPDKRAAAILAQEDYWTKVRALRERTKGFWQSEDVTELEQLKVERQTRIENISNAR